MARYLLHQPIGENRILDYSPEEKSVRILYKGELNQDTGFKPEKMDVLEFIARRIQHIFPPYFQRVRFMGIYSNKYRGQHKETHRELKPESQGIPRKKWNTSWRRVIWKIYDYDPIKCTTCGAIMKIKDVYTNETARVMRKKLIHLKYYIKRRWRKERRKTYCGPPDGRERRAT